MFLGFVAATSFWTALFYLLVWTRPYWMRKVISSSKTHENCKYWETRNVWGAIHAVVVSCLVIPVLLALSDAPAEVRVGTSPNLATCSQKDYPHMNRIGQAIALAGMLFTAFIASDSIISIVHRLSTWDFVVHHIAFLAAGLIIRGHCMLPYNAAILLSMEVSTPFLNVMLLFRNRGEKYQGIVQVTGIIFVVTFVLFRLVLNTYGVSFLWQHRADAIPHAVPRWQSSYLVVAIILGSVLQYFWFPAIAKIFVKGLKDLATTYRHSALQGACE